MVGYFFDFIKYIIETMAADACVARSLEHRESFHLRCLGVLAGSALLSAVLAILASYIGMGDYGLNSGLVYALLSLAAFGFVFFCYRGSVWNRIFCCMTGSMLRMCAKKIFDIVEVFWAEGGFDPALIEKGQALRYLLYYLIVLALYAAAFVTFGRLFRKGQGIYLNGKVTAVYLLVMFINLILNNIEPVLLAVDVRYYSILVFCEMAYYLLILAMQWFLFQMAHAEMDARTAHELWRLDKLQYEQMKENIETINIKCHDLRHHIRSIQESAGADGRIDGQFLREVEQSISIYDSVIKTGNEALDVVLTDKRLHCELNAIQLTSMVDGSALARMDATDIYSLFGNLLENAIEYESGIAEPEKRFISLTVKLDRQLAKIHIENYFEGELALKDGLPVTTKGEEGLHGYGLKSVRRIVQKYGGTMRVWVEDGMFQINILLPPEQTE